MPECLISEGLYLAPFMTRFLHNATKKMLFSDAVAAIPSQQLCIATKAPGVLLVSEESTKLKMPASPDAKGSCGNEEWVDVDADGLDDFWVDVQKDVPHDTGRGSSDVSKGTSSPSMTKIVLRAVNEYYQQESKEAFLWRMANTKNLSSRPSRGGFLDL